MDNALDEWKKTTVILEEQQEGDGVSSTQIGGGLNSIFDFEQVGNIARTWLELIDALPSGEKTTIANIFLKLYNMGQISIDVFMRIIEELIK